MSCEDHGCTKRSGHNFEITVEAPTSLKQVESNTLLSHNKSSTPLINQGYDQKASLNGDGSGVDDTTIDRGDDPPSPPDGGYGWFITLGCLIMHIIIGGLERADGIFFLQFQAKFHENAQLTAWPTAICSSIRLLVGPLTTVVSSFHSVRTCCMIGSLLHFTGLVLSSFPPNFLFLFFSQSLLQGLGRGFLYAPSLIIVNMYFNKRRSLAVGLATSGVGIGSFLIVPMTQLLFDTYGYSGAFLITAAWSLHSVVVAMLFRPLSLHYKLTCGKRMEQTRELSAMDEDVPASNDQTFVSDAIGSMTLTQKASNSKPDLPKSTRSPLKNCKQYCRSVLQTCFPKEECQFAKRKILHFYLLKDPAFLMFCIAMVLFTAAFRSAFTFVPALVKAKGYTDTEAAVAVAIAGVADTLGRVGTGCLFDCGCLRPYRIIFYNTFPFGLAIISFILPSLNNYIAFCVVNCFYGVFSGGYVSQKSVVIVDMLGAENIAASFGMLVCFQGLGALIGPPLAGAFKDMFGSFTEAFYLGGGFMGLAGVVMICSNLFLHVKKKRNRIIIDKEKEMD